jgi:uncharacterized membrane protein (UPF0127 family)
MFSSSSSKRKIKYTQRIQIGGKIIRVCSLISDRDKQLGYQAISVPPIQNKQGLLFIFDDNDLTEPRTFHMRNVLFDLDVLCFDKHGFLIEVIRNMKSPYDIQTGTCNKLLFNKTYSTKTNGCKYCIEVLAGWNGMIFPGFTRLKFI